MTNDTNELYKLAKFFMERNISIHITKKNNWFHNGKIKELSAEFIILDEERKGEIPVFFSEMTEISKREEKR